MNTSSIFYPWLHIGHALKQSEDLGLTRIEITYTADSMEAQDELFDEEFLALSELNLSNAYLAL